MAHSWPGRPLAGAKSGGCEEREKGNEGGKEGKGEREGRRDGGGDVVKSACNRRSFRALDQLACRRGLFGLAAALVNIAAGRFRLASAHPALSYFVERRGPAAHLALGDIVERRALAAQPALDDLAGS